MRSFYSDLGLMLSFYIKAIPNLTSSSRVLHKGNRYIIKRTMEGVYTFFYLQFNLIMLLSNFRVRSTSHYINGPRPATNKDVFSFIGHILTKRNTQAAILRGKRNPQNILIGLIQLFKSRLSAQILIV